jgi:putative phosphoserine phosphatase/1-acylglycerol-3-phosphate O-acyltransferase
VEDLARKGLSIVIAPEGTRLDTTTVGPFKKGPFRIAMSAGIPIVPVVIRNAEAIGARDSSTMNPGTVDVVVFPPISVEDWTVENLGEHIAGIRQLYLDTLANWPTGTVPDVSPYVATAPAKKTPAKKAAKKAPAKRADNDGEAPASGTSRKSVRGQS